MKLYSYIKVNCGLTKSEVINLYNDNKILINNVKLPLSCPVKDKDVVTLNGIIVKALELKYYLYYKPRGILSVISNNDNSYINQINSNIKLSPAGRLDKDSEGLMILTNDGNFINSISNPSSKITKEYIVKLKYMVTDKFMIGVQKSYKIKNRDTTPIIINKIDSYTVSMILSEGVYHQIRTIVKLNNNEVVSLKRIRIGEYFIGSMWENELIEFYPNKNEGN